MKKTVTILILGFLIISGIASSTTSNIEIATDKNFKQKESLFGSFNDILDQSQNVSNNILAIGRLPESMNYSYNITYAQSFIPQNEILTRIELNITRNETTIYDIVVAIRENLNGENLAYIHLCPEDINLLNFSWIEFDFEDIFVDVGKTYYIVSYTTNFTENWYLWAANNVSESYPYGCAWMSIDDGNSWSNDSYSFESNNDMSRIYNQGLVISNDSNITWDMCFNTYGRSNLPPEALDIEGPSEGTVGEDYTYEVYSLDPDGDNIYYYVDWGDNTSEEWIGPYSSEEIVKINHTWSAKGNYTIAVKARDIYGAESDWAYLEVTMPVNQQVINLLLQMILERFPNAFPILRHLLGL